MIPTNYLSIKTKIAFPAFCSILLATCVIAQTTVSGSFMFGGITRTYRLYIPAIYNPSVAVPLVLNLHGYGSNNTSQEAYGDFRPIADTANFIIAHPNGTLDGSGNRYWNSFNGSTVDDVGFLSALIDTISAGYTIDKNSVYSTGMSNGGFMSYDLACSLSYRIAAVASVTGSMIPPHKNSCSPLHPTPVMQIHGTADATVPYNGSSSFIHIDTLVNYWAKFNNCLLTPAITPVPDINTADGCTAERHVFDGGTTGSTVELFKIQGGGHSWPGAPVNINVTNMDFSASIEIWRFFRKYKLNVLSGGIRENVSETFSFNIHPNPSKDIFKIEFSGNSKKTITVSTCLGQVVQHFECSCDKANFSIENKGLYFITIANDNQVRTEKIVKY